MRWRCSIACSAGFFTQSTERSRLMSFRLTYGTMFNPPEAMHERFEAALATMQGRLGQVHPLFIDGRDREALGLEQRRSPITAELTLGRFPLAGTGGYRGGVCRRRGGLSRAGARLPVQRPRDGAAPRRGCHGAARLRNRRGARPRGRQEPDGSARRDAGDGRLLPLLRGRLRVARRLRGGAAGRPAGRRRLAQPQRAAAVRRLVDHRAVQFPAGARRRTDGGCARHRQHRGAQVRKRHAVVGPLARRLHTGRGPAAGRLQLPGRRRRRGRRGDGARSAHGGRDVHRLGGRRSQHPAAVDRGRDPEALHRRDGRQEPVHRDRARGSRPRGDRHRALGLRHGRTEVLGAVAAVRRPARGGRPARAHREAGGRDPDRRPARCARTGSARSSTPMRTATTRATSTSSARRVRPCDAAGGSCGRTAAHRVTTSSPCSPRRRPRIRCGARRCSCRS